MPVLVNNEVIIPAQAAGIKIILARHHVEFAHDGRHAYVRIGDGCLVEQNNIPLALFAANAIRRVIGKQPVYIIDAAGLAIHACRKYNPAVGIVKLFPF